MARNRTARSRVLSLRSALIMGAVGVLTVGMAQIGGTMAASTDTATAESGTLASVRNFWPTPVVPENARGTDYAAPCFTRSVKPGKSAQVEWDPVPGATGYYIAMIRGNHALTTPTASIPSGSSGNFYQWTVSADARNLIIPDIRSGGFSNGEKAWIRVHTVNGPRTSTGWAGAQIVQTPNTTNNSSQCTDDYHEQPNVNAWEDYYDVSGDFSGDALGRLSKTTFGRMGLAQEPNESEESTTAAAPSTAEGSTTPTTSAEETSSSATPTPTTSTSSSSKNPSGTPSGTPPTTPSGTPSGTPPKTPSGTSPTAPSDTSSGTPSDTPTTTTPAPEKPELAGKATGGPAGVTAGTSANGKKAIVVDGNGELLAEGAIEQGSTLKWLDGELWIIGESQVSRISATTGDNTWKFYSDGGELPPSLSGD